MVSWNCPRSEITPYPIDNSLFSRGVAYWFYFSGFFGNWFNSFLSWSRCVIVVPCSRLLGSRRSCPEFQLQFSQVDCAFLIPFIWLMTDMIISSTSITCMSPGRSSRCAYASILVPSSPVKEGQRLFIVFVSASSRQHRQLTPE